MQQVELLGGQVGKLVINRVTMTTIFNIKFTGGI